MNVVRRPSREVESAFEGWAQALDAAEVALLELVDEPDDELPSTELLSFWPHATRAHERARALTANRFQSRDAQPCIDDVAFRYVELLERHQALDRDWDVALRTRVAWCAELFVEAHAAWAQCAHAIECAPPEAGELTPEMDQALIETERCFRRAERAARALEKLAALSVKAAADAADDAATAMVKADRRQLEIRRRRLKPFDGPVVAWDESGVPQFNDPRPPRSGGTGRFSTGGGPPGPLSSPVISKRRKRP